MKTDALSNPGRIYGFDILKCICAFLVICIHAHLPENINIYVEPLTRTAVPIFFMITGFFYNDTVKKNKTNKQIIRILNISIIATILYGIWSLLIYDGSVYTFLKASLHPGQILYFLLFNVPIWGNHLWYLWSLLYILLLSKIVLKYFDKIVYYFIPLLLAAGLILGKYSLCILGRDISHIFSRNFLFTGIPFFYLGKLFNEWFIKRNASINKLSDTGLIILMVLFYMTSLCEGILINKLNMYTKGDLYISTAFLASAAFVFFLRKNNSNENKALDTLALVGKKYSLIIYIIHVIFRDSFVMLVDKISIYLPYAAKIYSYTSPIFIAIPSIFLAILIKDVIEKKIYYKL